jgi:hypothetical protein
MTIIQTSIAIAVAIAGTAATTAAVIHVTAPAPLFCQPRANAEYKKLFADPAPYPTTGNPTVEFK